MDINEIISILVEKLNNDIPEVQAIAYPDRPDNYRLSHPNGALLVSHTSTYYSEPQGNRIINNLTFSVNIITRQLNGNSGAYELTDKVRKSLTNNLYICGSRFYPKSSNFVVYDDDKWIHESTFTLLLISRPGE